LLEHLKQDVKRCCSGMVYELSEINDALGRTVESTLQVMAFCALHSMCVEFMCSNIHTVLVTTRAQLQKGTDSCVLQDFKFLHLETLRSNLADPPSSNNSHNLSIPERTSATKQRRLRRSSSPNSASRQQVNAREMRIEEKGGRSDIEIEHPSPNTPLRWPSEAEKQLGDISPISTVWSSAGAAFLMFAFWDSPLLLAASTELMTLQIVTYVHTCIITQTNSPLSGRVADLGTSSQSPICRRLRAKQKRQCGSYARSNRTRNEQRGKLLLLLGTRKVSNWRLVVGSGFFRFAATTRDKREGAKHKLFAYSEGTFR
jgi:hypothetical protein